MTNLKNEKLQILKMVEEGKISSDEGIKLLEAIENANNNDSVNKKAKWIKVKVLDADDKNKVDVTIPVSLVNVGLKMANKISPEFKKSGLDDNDIKEIFEAIKDGATGKIVDIKGDNGEKVEVIVE